MEEKKLKYCISVDWLEIYCETLQVKLLVGEKYNPPQKEWWAEPKDYGTRFFAHAYSIMNKGREWASLVTCPRASFIDKHVCLLKLSNRVLYTTRWDKLWRTICEVFELKPKGITRLDLAYDCNVFLNGYKPHKFIKDFVAKEPEEAGYIHHYGVREWTMCGSKIAGERSKFSYIRFGARTSNVQSYIYNKSKEMREVKHKQYIADMWQRAGLVNDGKTDVWRVEISIRSQGLKLLSKETGELFRLLPDETLRTAKIHALFEIYANRYLRFGVRNGQRYAKDYDRLKLFDFSDNQEYLPYQVSDRMDVGRTEKLIAKRLKEASEKYSDMPYEMAYAFALVIAYWEHIGFGKDIDYTSQKFEAYINQLKGSRWLADDGLRSDRMTREAIAHEATDFIYRREG